MARVKGWGSMVLSSATTVDEARYLETRGVDAVIAQGAEAGGHRGMFLSEDLAGQPDTIALVRQCVRAVNVPVIAAGGIADARRRQGRNRGRRGGRTGRYGVPVLSRSDDQSVASRGAEQRRSPAHGGDESVHRQAGSRHRQSADAGDRSAQRDRARIPVGVNRHLRVAIEGRGEGRQRLHLNVGRTKRRGVSGDAGGGTDTRAGRGLAVSLRDRLVTHDPVTTGGLGLV